MRFFRCACVLVCVAIFCNSYAVAQQHGKDEHGKDAASKRVQLPAEWHGTWRGEVMPQSVTGDGAPFQMELEIAQLPEKDRLKWKIVYRGPQGESVRDYQLVNDPADSSRFVIDEQNSILIPASLLGNTLQSHFEVAGQVLWTRYELVAEAQPSIIFELVTARNEPLSSGGEGVPKVSSLVPVSRQVARLIRSKE